MLWKLFVLELQLTAEKKEKQGETTLTKLVPVY